MVAITMVAMILMRCFVVSPGFQVDGQSMYPTFYGGEKVEVNGVEEFKKGGGERLIVSILPYLLFHEPRRCDIITFYPPGAEGNVTQEDLNSYNVFQRFVYDYVPEFLHRKSRSFIKRVIGLPGERVQVKDNGCSVLVNGKALREGYVKNCQGLQESLYYDVVVPKGHVFALGDNRDYSRDSRWFGMISLDDIQGRADAVFWPWGRIAWLSNPCEEEEAE